MWERGAGSTSHWGTEQGFLEEGTFGKGPRGWVGFGQRDMRVERRGCSRQRKQANGEQKQER